LLARDYFHRRCAAQIAAVGFALSAQVFREEFFCYRPERNPILRSAIVVLLVWVVEIGQRRAAGLRLGDKRIGLGKVRNDLILSSTPPTGGLPISRNLSWDLFERNPEAIRTHAPNQNSALHREAFCQPNTG